MKTSKTSKVYKLQNNCFTDSRDLYSKFTDTRDYKVYSCFIRTFSPREEVEAYIRNTDWDEYAYIYHDKDVKEDGSLKEPHFHILVYRKAGFRLQSACRTFTQNTLIQPVRSRCHSYQYLVHKNDPDKAQYSASDICEYHANDKNTFAHTVTEQKEQTYSQMLDDLAQMSHRELAVKYGRDYMLNVDRYERFMQRVEREDTAKDVDKLVADIGDFEPLSEVIVVDCDGETFHYDACNWFAGEICRQLEESPTLPDSSQLLSWYANILSQYRRFRKNYGKSKKSS